MIAGLNPRVPVIADADTGFGGATMCARTTTLYARAGDQVQQKRCGHLASKQLVPLEEYVVRIRAAANARKALDFRHRAHHALGRTRRVGVDTAIARCKAAIDAGADIAFVEGLRNAGDAERAMGFKLVIFPCAGMIPAALAVRAAYREIRAQGTDVASCGRCGAQRVIAIDAAAGGNFTLGG
ncbi:Pyruvate/Phosphoenolpyruvate kinase-like domain-containing protein [Mycena olivaceomarginata]|nr:Pyruvate/Phosphoenolpyruvate kinase-like domain-containing protein [Mycena olivaceomarginata]